MPSHYGEDDMDEKKKPTPEMLGTGAAARAASALASRNERMKAETCRAFGGTYDFATGKCKGGQ